MGGVEQLAVFGEMIHEHTPTIGLKYPLLFSTLIDVTISRSNEGVPIMSRRLMVLALVFAAVLAVFASISAAQADPVDSDRLALDNLRLRAENEELKQQVDELKVLLEEMQKLLKQMQVALGIEDSPDPDPKPLIQSQDDDYALVMRISDIRTVGLTSMEHEQRDQRLLRFEANSRSLGEARSRLAELERRGLAGNDVIAVARKRVSELQRRENWLKREISDFDKLENKGRMIVEGSTTTSPSHRMLALFDKKAARALMQFGIGNRIAIDGDPIAIEAGFIGIRVSRFSILADEPTK